MIFNKDTKGFETRSDKPNENWTDDNTLIVIDDSSELANKIIENYPYFECVFEGDKLIDVIPTERPEPEPIPEAEPTTEELLNIILGVDE